MTKVRRIYTDNTETNGARNIEQVAGTQPTFTEQGGFCKACNRWSIRVNAEKCLCKHCEQRESELG